MQTEAAPARDLRCLTDLPLPGILRSTVIGFYEATRMTNADLAAIQTNTGANQQPVVRRSTSYAHDKAKILARLRRMEGGGALTTARR